MEISKETKGRIAKEASQKTDVLEARLKDKNLDYGRMISQLGGYETGYILGAEAEATRAEVLIDCLLKIRHNHYTENAVDKKIDEALSQYNNSK